MNSKQRAIAELRPKDATGSLEFIAGHPLAQYFGISITSQKMAVCTDQTMAGTMGVILEEKEWADCISDVIVFFKYVTINEVRMVHSIQSLMKYSHTGGDQNVVFPRVIVPLEKDLVKSVCDANPSLSSLEPLNDRHDTLVTTISSHPSATEQPETPLPARDFPSISNSESSDMNSIPASLSPQPLRKNPSQLGFLKRNINRVPTSKVSSSDSSSASGNLGSRVAASLPKPRTVDYSAVNSPTLKGNIKDVTPINYLRGIADGPAQGLSNQSATNVDRNLVFPPSSGNVFPVSKAAFGAKTFNASNASAEVTSNMQSASFIYRATQKPLFPSSRSNTMSPLLFPAVNHTSNVNDPPVYRRSPVPSPRRDNVSPRTFSCMESVLTKESTRSPRKSKYRLLNEDLSMYDESVLHQIQNEWYYEPYMLHKQDYPFAVGGFIHKRNYNSSTFEFFSIRTGAIQVPDTEERKERNAVYGYCMVLGPGNCTAWEFDTTPPSFKSTKYLKNNGFEVKGYGILAADPHNSGGKNWYIWNDQLGFMTCLPSAGRDIKAKYGDWTPTLRAVMFDAEMVNEREGRKWKVTHMSHVEYDTMSKNRWFPRHLYFINKLKLMSKDPIKFYSENLNAEIYVKRPEHAISLDGSEFEAFFIVDWETATDRAFYALAVYPSADRIYGENIYNKLLPHVHKVINWETDDCRNTPMENHNRSK